MICVLQIRARLRLGSQYLRDRPVNGRVRIVSERRLQRYAVHRIDHLALHLSLDLALLLTRVQYVHRLEVEGADPAHEHLLQLLLHHGFGPVLTLDYGLRLAQLVPQALYLLAVLRADVLELLLDSLLEVLSPLDHLPLLVVLLPAKEDSAPLVLS